VVQAVALEIEQQYQEEPELLVKEIPEETATVLQHRTQVAAAGVLRLLDKLAQTD